MFIESSENILTLAGRIPNTIIVNPVNCVGVMGAGLAKAVKEHYPTHYRQYVTACSRGEVKLGHIFETMCDNRSRIDRTKGVSGIETMYHFPTKNHFSEKSTLDNIIVGLTDLNDVIEHECLYDEYQSGYFEMPSILLPKIGCGLGGLKYNEVKPQIVRLLEKASNACDIYLL